MRMAGWCPDYLPGPVRIASARQFQASIDESVKQLVEHYIHTLGLDAEFDIQKYAINHRNGSHMFFPGFNRNVRSLMSAEGVDVLWIEQAETLGGEMEIIAPTIRKPGSEIWLTWNPISRAQWCWKRFQAAPRDGDMVIEANYDRNPWFPKELDDERRAMHVEEPERYAHVWLGKPDDADGDKQVLTYKVLQACVEAYRRGLAPDGNITDAGLDIAEGGRDKCALAIRRGPVVDYLDMWPGITGDLSQCARRAHEAFSPRATGRLYYDGAHPIRTDLLRFRPAYRVIGVNFGGAVGGPDVHYERGRPNDQVFSRRNIQMADTLRLRANRTFRLLNGETGIDPATCLFISDKIPRLERFLSNLTGPIRRVNPTTGKWELDKRGGDENAESPDDFDALCLAYARDSDHGLRAR